MPVLKLAKELHVSHLTQFMFVVDLDSDGKSLIQRKRRCFTKAEKQHMDKVRKAGACPNCRRKKTKVNSLASKT